MLSAMEGPAKFTPEQIEKNKTREATITKMMAEGGQSHINERGEVEIIASEKTQNDARTEMDLELSHGRFYEKYKDLIGKNVHVVFTTDLEDAAPGDVSRSGWFSFGNRQSKQKQIDTVLKDISDGGAVLEFEGKDIFAFMGGIEEIRLKD